MNIFSVTVRLLKRYPALIASVMSAITISSMLEGASFAMLIPIVQSMTTGSIDMAGKGRLFQWLGQHLISGGGMTQVARLFIMLLSLIAVKNIFIYLAHIRLAKLRFSISRDLQVALMDDLIDYDVAYFDSMKAGHILSVLNNETRRMGDFMSSMLNFLSLSMKIFIYIALMFLISWQASIAVFALIASVLIPLEFIMRKVKRIGVQISRAHASIDAKIFEILSGIRVIKSFVAERIEKKLFKEAADDVYRYQYKHNLYSGLIIPLSETLILLLAVGCFLMMMRVKSVDMARLFPFIATYLLVLVRMLTQLNNLNARRSEAMSNLAAFSMYDNMRDKEGKKTIESGSRVPGPLSRGIEFAGVGFAYADGKSVLKDININIRSGKTTAIVGVSGAGKSTLINMILRFYDTVSGRITIDGINIKDIDLGWWRRSIGLVSQDVFIFNTTVKDNIAYGSDSAVMDDVVRAAKLANAHDFIMALPQQYETVLGDRGVKISGGQKQRISIARAILHDPQILIMDEATSSLDSETEKSIKDAMDRLAKDRTVIAIAHRLSTVAHADNIVVLDGGKVVESGSHVSLISRESVYKRLYEAQFGMIKEA
jgi:subfamily B ATP-binding cassette protein MsbA